MRKPMILIATLILISFCVTACSTVAGDVVPKTGPKMEQVYDSMQSSGENSNVSIDAHPKKMSEIRSNLQTQSLSYSGNKESVNRYIRTTGFHRLKNPELRMYVYPHFSGSDQVPVPGYETVFNAYEHDYYGIPGQE